MEPSYKTYSITINLGDRPRGGSGPYSCCFILHGDDGTKIEGTSVLGPYDDPSVRVIEHKVDVTGQKCASISSVDFWWNSSGWTINWLKESIGLGHSWRINTIVVSCPHSQEKQVFPVFNWIRAKHHHTFLPDDTSLPQNDDNKAKRDAKLTEMRKMYQLKQIYPGFPPQVASLPAAEGFSFVHKLGSVVHTLTIKLGVVLEDIWAHEWKNVEEIGQKIFIPKQGLTQPSAINRWANDVAFGMQRLAGINNIWIRLCKKIPEKFGVSEDELKSLLEGQSLKEALAKKRLFMIDYWFLRDIPTKPDAVCCAPIALFFCNSKKQLVPVAIQLFQDKCQTNPVFYPSDGKYTWILAKMWFNNADAVVHQSLTHLGFTHVLMEGIAVVTHRNLAVSHPIFRLLAPHFLYLMAINAAAQEKLLNEDGWVNKVLPTGVKGLAEVVGRMRPRWHLNVEGTLPEDLKERGVDDPNILPEYHFRDDALLLYGAIKKYVTDYVSLYYDQEDSLLKDNELLAWRQQLVAPITNGGCGIHGVPGNRQFTTNEQLVMTLTAVIYTCSAGHAAANFKQYDEYGFAPNYPASLQGNPPTTKADLKELDVLSALPDTKTMHDTMIITSILSTPDKHGPLGDFEVQYAVQPEAVKVADKFRQDLQNIHDIIEKRNQTRDTPYLYLDPKLVPNSISI